MCNPMSLRWATTALLLLILVCVVKVTFAASIVPRLETVPCWFEVKPDIPVRCMKMYVAQTRGGMSTRTVEFPVVILHTQSERRLKDAVLIPGGGGPGSAIGLTQHGVESLWRSNDWILEGGRDVILIDPRGVGMAKPNLACHEFGTIIPQLWSKLHTSTEELAVTLQAYQRCKQRFVHDKIDLNAFHTDSTAMDIEELRRLLDIEQWNIYGTSYGANVALVVAQRFPRSVRSLILDSFQPPDARFFDDYTQTVGTAFEQLFEQCQSDKDCARDYPDLKKVLVKLVEQADAKPLHLVVAHPYSLEPFPVVLSGTGLLSLIRSALYNEEDIAGLPEVIYALSRGSMDLLAPLVREGLRDDLDQSYSDGVHLSTNCREEVPFNDMQGAMRQANNHPYARDMMLSVLEYYQSVCQLWEVMPAAVESIQPAKIEVPALILSGSLDPVTPAKWSAQSQGRFNPLYRHEFVGVSHDVIAATYCAAIVAAYFLEDPKHDPLGHSCLKEDRRIRFRLLPH